MGPRRPRSGVKWVTAAKWVNGERLACSLQNGVVQAQGSDAETR